LESYSGTYVVEMQPACCTGYNWNIDLYVCFIILRLDGWYTFDKKLSR
jgi:hypothetical protein